MLLCLAQLNPTVGDLDGNAARIGAVRDMAVREGADLIVLPELALTGYPPRDLLLQDGFLSACRQAILRLTAGSGPEALVVGAPWCPPKDADAPPDAFDPACRPTNSLLVLRGGRVEARYDKRLLPTYDVFDEDRYFRAGDRPCLIEVSGVRVGLSICEDLWKGVDASVPDRYLGRPDPVEDLVRAGARLIINASASPFVVGKGARQREIMMHHAQRHRVGVAAVNQVGANDDLIFDGYAAVVVPDARGARVIASSTGFSERPLFIDLGADPARWAGPDPIRDQRADVEEQEELLHALVLGVRDYCSKTGFASCVLGLSGGIDSALTACIATRALGPSKVLGVSMPSRFSSEGSIADAVELGARLGIRVISAPIDGPHRAVEALAGPVFNALGADPAPGVAEENVQSRLRGLILMAISNKTGAILLTTGNKSELAVGYCTLYGDTNGGLGVLSDLTKGQVYALARWINRSAGAAGFSGPPIPESSLTKPPSAELRPNQTDQDTLPPYEVLDVVVERYVEGRQSPARIARETGFDPALVARLARMIDLAEHKRRQLPVGLKVTAQTFGPGRRWPIAQRYRPS